MSSPTLTSVTVSSSPSDDSSQTDQSPSKVGVKNATIRNYTVAQVTMQAFTPLVATQINATPIAAESQQDSADIPDAPLAPPLPSPPVSIHWSNLLSTLSRFSQRYSYFAKEESNLLTTLQGLQRRFHILGRQTRVMHAWGQFLAHDDLGWLERNEQWQANSTVHALQTYGPIAGWAGFLRFLRAHPRLLALLAVPTGTRSVDKVQSMLGYSLLTEKTAIAETLCFSFFGGMSAERELECFRSLLRYMLREEVVALRAVNDRAACGYVVDFWSTLAVQSTAPVDRETHLRAVANSFGFGSTTPAQSAPSSATGPLSPTSPALSHSSSLNSLSSPSSTVGSTSSTASPSPANPNSAAASSLRFRTRPLRMILLELMLRRSTCGGSFVASILANPLRAILQDDKKNLDPDEVLVATILGAAAAQQAKETVAKKGPSTLTKPLDVHGLSINTNMSAPQPLPLSSPKVKQAVRVTEQLLCTSADQLLDALIVAGPRWPLSVKLLLGDMLRCSEKLWPANSSSSVNGLQTRVNLGAFNAAAHRQSIMNNNNATGNNNVTSTTTALDVMVTSIEDIMTAAGQDSPDESATHRISQNTSNHPPLGSSPPSNDASPPTVPYTVQMNNLLSDENSSNNLFAKNNVAASYMPTSTLASSANPSINATTPAIVIPNAQALAAKRGSIAASVPVASNLPLEALSDSTDRQPTFNANAPPPPLPPRLRSMSRFYGAGSVSAVQIVPMMKADRAMLLTHILFGLLVLPALQKPHLSGLYMDAPLRTRARLNLKIICCVLEQVLLCEPFPPSNHLSCINRYVVQKGNAVREHMARFADHCVQLSSQRLPGIAPSPSLDEEDREIPQTASATHDRPSVGSNDDSETVSAAVLGTPLVQSSLAASLSTSVSSSNTAIFPEFGSAKESSSSVKKSSLPTVSETSTDTSSTALFTPTPQTGPSAMSFSTASLPFATTLCVSLHELVTIHQALFRHHDRVMNHSTSKSLKRVWEELQKFKALPTNGAEAEWTEKQVCEMELFNPLDPSLSYSEAAATACGISSSAEPFERMQPLTKRIENFIKDEFKEGNKLASFFPDKPKEFDPQPLLILLTHTFLSLPPSCIRSYAASRSDLPSLLSHVRHALESSLDRDEEWEVSSSCLGIISELEVELKRIVKAHYSSPAYAVGSSTSGRTHALRHTASFIMNSKLPLLSAAGNIVGAPLQIPSALNKSLFSCLTHIWANFEDDFQDSQSFSTELLLNVLNESKNALNSLRAELRYLRLLSFNNKVLIFAKQKRNVSQNMHLAKLKFNLPPNFGPPPPPSLQQALQERRETIGEKASGSAFVPPPLISSLSARDVSNTPNQRLEFCASSIEHFIALFEFWGTSFSKDLPLAAKLLHAFLTHLELAVRKDVGLNHLEMQGVNRSMNTNLASISMQELTEQNTSTAAPSDEFVDEPLEGDALVTRAMDLLEHALCTRLYPYIFPSDRSTSSFEDEMLHWKMKGLSWLQPRHVHLPTLTSDDPCWTRSMKALEQLDHFHSPSSKLACLTKALKWLAKMLGAKPAFKHLDADSTLSGLIFLLVKTKPQRLPSNLLFVETFLPPNKMVGEQAYVLTQWSLAAHYVGETLSVYDEATLDAEIEAQRLMEEARKKGKALAVTAESVAATNGVEAEASSAASLDDGSNPPSARRRMTESLSPPGVNSSPRSSPRGSILLGIAAAVGPGGSRSRSASLLHPSPPGAKPVSLEALSLQHAATSTKGELIALAPVAVALTPMPLVASTVTSAFPAAITSSNNPSPILRSPSPPTGSPNSLVGLTPSSAALSAASLLALSLKASKSRASNATAPFTITACSQVLRNPALFHVVLAWLPVRDTAILSAVSSQWNHHCTHAVRKASVTSTAAQQSGANANQTAITVLTASNATNNE